VAATNILYGSRDVVPVFDIEVGRQFGKSAADMAVCVYAFVRSYESADIVRVLKVGDANERFLWRVAQIGYCVFTGSHIKETVVVDGKFGVGKWFCYRFLMLESS